MVNFSKNLLPCAFQNLGLQCEHLLFGPRCNGPVLREKGSEEDLRRPYFQRAKLLDPGFSSARAVERHKNKKGRRKKKENPVWRQGWLKGRLSVQL